MKMTKLCCFNQDNPNSLAFDHHAELAASEQVRLTLTFDLDGSVQYVLSLDTVSSQSVCMCVM